MTELADKIRDEARNTFLKVCETLPYNRNRVYCEIFLENSKCKIYIPLRDNIAQGDKAKQAKGFYEKLANTAEL